MWATLKDTDTRTSCGHIDRGCWRRSTFDKTVLKDMVDMGKDMVDMVVDMVVAASAMAASAEIMHVEFQDMVL